MPLGLAEAAALVAKGEASAVELTTQALDALAGEGGRLGAVAALDREAALATAARLDGARREGRPLGPLHGVPLAHKAMFYRQGRPTDLGSRLRRGFVPGVTAAALERLDRAGAVDMGQLQMVEFALGVTGRNEIAGTPLNPWGADLVPGGSSSGSAVAVAAGLVPAALGSDTGGSIRVPAACCNLVGLKPTYGRISRFGAMPLSPSLDHVGAFARDAYDAALMLEALAGPDPRDRTTSPRPAPKAEAILKGDLKGLRVGLAEGPFGVALDPAVAAGIEATARTLEGLGAIVMPVRLPPLEPCIDARNIVMRVEAASHHRPWLETMPDAYQDQTRVRMAPGLEVRAVDYMDALRGRASRLAAFVGAVFADAAVLLLPALAGPVPTTAAAGVTGADFLELVAGMGHFIFPFNDLGLPAMSVPTAPLSNGSPGAVQFAGRPFSETLLLRIAYHLDRESGFSRRRPPG